MTAAPRRIGSPGGPLDLDLVERLVGELPGVAEAVVVAVACGGPPRMVAAARLEPGVVATAVELRDALGSRIPVALVPVRIVVVDELPRHATGAPDRAAVATLVTRPPAEADQPVGRFEALVADRWSARLAVPVGRHDDVFELGGDFALATATVAALEDAGGARLPASALLGAPTPATLATLAGAGPVDDTVVVIQPGTRDEPPVVVAYDMDGSAFTMRDLARSLGPEVPVWGLDSALLRGDGRQPTDLAGLVALHVADLVARRPDGPYRVIGYSMGAVVAYELARQLRSSGRTVDLVGLIDLGPVHTRHQVDRRRGMRPAATYPWRPPSTARRLRRAAAYAGHVRSLPPGRRAEYAARALSVGREYDLARCRADLRRHGRIRPSLRPVWGWFGLMDAAVAYETPPLPGDATLFVCEQTAKGNIPTSPKVDFASKLDPTLGWGPHVRGHLDTRPVVGVHTDLIEPPYVWGLGREVRRALDERGPGPWS